MLTWTLPPALAARARAGALPHGWILAGAGEPELEEAARTLAAAFLCQDPDRRPCGTCKHCRKVEKGIHPDLQWVEKYPDKRQLVVEQIRALRSDAYIRPNEAERKVYILQNAQQMNDEAQNAFLKVLEEGPEYAVFLLLSENHLALLPTIRSRCELLRLTGAEAGGDSLRLGGELAGLLLGGDRWRLLAWCVPWEKAGREDVVALWKVARETLLTCRDPASLPRAVRLGQTLGELLSLAQGSGNLGALWGRLYAAQE